MSAQINGVTLVSGITQTRRSTLLGPMFDFKTNAVVFDSGCMGFSVTSFSATGVPSWAVEVYSNVGGAFLMIGGATGIGSTTSGFVNLQRLNGTTAHQFLGIPRPDRLDIVGSSTTVGSTFSIAVGFKLRSP